MSVVVLRGAHPAAVVAEAFQETEEPRRDVRAAAAHEVDLVGSDCHVLERRNLARELVGKARGITRAVAVGEAVAHLSARVVLDHGAAHRELIEVVVGEVGDNLSHRRQCLLYNNDGRTFGRRRRAIYKFG